MRIHIITRGPDGLQPSQSKFPLGHTVTTPGALETVPDDEMLLALIRHHHGDWGDVCEHDRLENELSLREGFRLHSVYHTAAGIEFWIMTEHDRSVTTILLPEDY